MAFALWVDEQCAWAEGTHEYRPMGVAVIAVTDLFRPRDFDPKRKAPSRQAVHFAGFFASLPAVNDFMALQHHHKEQYGSPPVFL